MDNCNEKEWMAAITLLSDWEKGLAHLDNLLEETDPGRLRWLVMQVFRDWEFINRILDEQLQRKPRPLALNLLRLAVGELLQRQPERHPKIVHHSVNVAAGIGLSRKECGFINGVLRSIIRRKDTLPDMDLLSTHPSWLVNRWISQFGANVTRELLAWNQSIPELTVRADTVPAYARKTQWEGYFYIEPGQFTKAKRDLDRGAVYLQDPFARIPVELLNIRQGESVLDLCAAPGGKTRLMAKALAGTGKLVAVDKPGSRLKRLQGNIARIGADNVITHGCLIENLVRSQMQDIVGIAQFDCVLIDVPCSNTGVMQKRPDVKLSISRESIRKHAVQQLEFLSAASRFVKPDGRLVYSTCSIDTEENAGVVETFLDKNPGWRLVRSVVSYPWECNHDGGGAFLLTFTAAE